MRWDDYLAVIAASRLNPKLKGAFTRFVDTVTATMVKGQMLVSQLSTFTQKTSVAGAVPARTGGETLIDTLCRAGLLRPHLDRGYGDNAASYCFTVPHLGEMLHALSHGKAAICRCIRRLRRKEVLIRDLKKKKLSMTLPFELAVLECEVSGACTIVQTPSGKMIRLVTTG